MEYPKSFSEEFKKQLTKRNIALSRASEYNSISEAYTLSKSIPDWDTLIEKLKSLSFMDYKCSQCNKPIIGTIPEADKYGIVYCDKCADKHLSFCETCDERIPKHEMIKTNDCYYCKNCYKN